jgi:hypothetical protein
VVPVNYYSIDDGVCLLLGTRPTTADDLNRNAFFAVVTT